jgi:sortase A
LVLMSLAKINNWLLGLIILLNLYVITAPILPAIIFKIESHSGQKQALQRIINKSQSTPASQAVNNSVQGNSLVIPAMLLNQPILEGAVSQQYKILDQGIWRWPKGSTPNQGGNTVLIGHRFTYTIPKGAFYYLNKLGLGDQIGVFWNHKEYIYGVAKISVVSPNDTSIEQNTNNPELTLFTCTPLLLPKDRLVVVADLETQK